MKLLITGGTGSFGNAYIQNSINSKKFSEIYIFSRDEKKQDDLRKLYASEKLKFFLGDVRDYDSVKNVVKNVDYIFHAAALKQVPSCEFFPMQAVKTNIIGTSNILNAAEEYDISNQKQINRAVALIVEQLNSTFLDEQKQEQERFSWFIGG